MRSGELLVHSGRRERRGPMASEIVDDPATESARAVFEKAKQVLRQRMRALRAALPEAAWQARSAKICESLRQQPAYRSARSLALFWPILDRREVDLRPLDARAREDGLRVFYPFMDRRGTGYQTGFRRVTDPGSLVERGNGFAEPAPDAPRAKPGELDLIVVPALAAAPSGHRLGYGSGFYDATLPEFCPPAQTLVVIYDFQLLAELPHAAHDLPCRAIVTDARTLEVQP